MHVLSFFIKYWHCMLTGRYWVGLMFYDFHDLPSVPHSVKFQLTISCYSFILGWGWGARGYFLESLLRHLQIFSSSLICATEVSFQAFSPPAVGCCCLISVLAKQAAGKFRFLCCPLLVLVLSQTGRPFIPGLKDI